MRQDNAEAKRAGALRFGAIAAVLGALAGGGAMALWSAGPGSDRAATERIVRDYILANPEILPEAMQRLQQRQTGAAVEQNRAAIEQPFHGAWAGAADADVVLVEFFDYACGFCRAANEDIDRLLREDDRLKVVWRELPVLGPGSEAAARISLAAARQGRFKPFYDRLFGLGRPSQETIEQAARAAGVDLAAAEDFRDTPEVRAEIERNYELARALGASGTPTFVVGDQVLNGAVGYEALRDAIAEARSASPAAT